MLNGIVTDRLSYQLGMLTAFAEMVSAGVKGLGLSPPLHPEELDCLMLGAERLAEAYGLHLYLDKDFLTTDLFDPEFTRGKYVLLIYQDPKVKDAYLGLKAEKENMARAGEGKGGRRKEIARKLGRLLGYGEGQIERMLSKGSNRPYMLD
jgi:hypothetical protein